MNSEATDMPLPGTSEWDPQLYQTRHSFVWQYGKSLLELLVPRPGQRILDLGCGTGQLTAEIAASGAQVIGIDNSPQMVAQARENFPELQFELADAVDFHFPEPFDAVFSNAALHWIKTPERVVRSVAHGLKPGGRFVAELGGKGNVREILAAVRTALQALGVGGYPDPWYFPSLAQYATLLESHSLSVTFAALFERPTPLQGGQGMRNWIKTFGGSFLGLVPAEREEEFIRLAEDAARARLYRDGVWSADYRRLRVVALKEE
jgi:trans-aconitate methyltransferase